MIKKFKFTIEIQADIPDQLNPGFIQSIIAETDREERLPNYQPPLSKIQAFIDYIQNHENILAECLADDLYITLSADGFNEILTHLLNPKPLDQIALENAPELDAEIKDFIIDLYKDREEENKNAKIDENGNPIPNSRQIIEDALEREIHTEIIQQSLLNYEITAVSMKEVKDLPPQNK